jgi:hypothetical protein
MTEKREPIESAIAGRQAILRANSAELSRLEHKVVAAVVYMLPLMQKREGGMFIGQLAAIAYGIDRAAPWQIKKTGQALRRLHELGVLVDYRPARGGRQSFLSLGKVPEPGTISPDGKVPEPGTERFPISGPKGSRTQNPNGPYFGVPTEGRSPKDTPEGRGAARPLALPCPPPLTEEQRTHLDELESALRLVADGSEKPVAEGEVEDVAAYFARLAPSRLLDLAIWIDDCVPAGTLPRYVVMHVVDWEADDEIGEIGTAIETDGEHEAHHIGGRPDAGWLLATGRLPDERRRL